MEQTLREEPTYTLPNLRLIPWTSINPWYYLQYYLFIYIFIHCTLLFFRYFLHLHFKSYPKSLLYPLPPCSPTQSLPTSWPWRFPVLGHIKFARPRGLSSQWWPTRPSSAASAGFKLWRSYSLLGLLSYTTRSTHGKQRAESQQHHCL
jgi:hypothetical protein